MTDEPSLPHHHLPVSGVSEILRGEGGPDTVGLLLKAERSRRLLLLRMLDDATDLGPAWDLLSRTQRHSPEVIEDLLMYPQTGMWLATALRRLRGTTAGDDEPPLWVVLGHANALAAAAALRAGLDFSLDVPVRHGRVPLPTLGCAVLPVTAPWALATARADGGHATLTGPGGTVTLPPAGTPGPRWHPVRRLTVGAEGGRLDITLDDTDPYRTYPRPAEPRPLSADDTAHWRHLLERAWAVLLAGQPATADAMRRGLLSLTPTVARERFRPRSVTSGDAFGGVEASEPDDALQLAVTLVHEFQHVKLGGLLHLAPLLTPETGADPPEWWYAPWRDDPRPVEGLLQGIYAFVGITRFWAGHRAVASEQSGLAHFEFALWRAQVARAVAEVRDHPRRTPLGAALLDTLAAHCARWLTEPVPAQWLELARLCADDHLARWRAHHHRPPAAAVDAAVRAWSRRAAVPPRAAAAEPEVVPSPSARWLDSLTVLVRYRLSGSDDDRVSPDGPEKRAARVTGALTGDALLSMGDPAAARNAYLTDLAADPGTPAAWAGLGSALDLAGTDPAAARLLRRRPELARAVHRALLSASGTAPDPVRLAGWLGALES
ncbi:aKG-HExxH-type peptide beta-hydroxylase [Streptomyces antibioticus]|uniref:aKG-HExxH-type peptide beta-hydroxylase n=1 Tax=Streptomyces antibioticus TaxID=1890 RepID=UPI00368B229B